MLLLCDLTWSGKIVNPARPRNQGTRSSGGVLVVLGNHVKICKLPYSGNQNTKSPLPQVGDPLSKALNQAALNWKPSNIEPL